MKVLMFGGTGVAGRAALRHLRDETVSVSVPVRDEAGRSTVTALGATALHGDQHDPGQLRRWLDGVDAVVDLRVRIPGAARAVLPGAWREYVRLRDTAAGMLVDAAIDAAIPRLVHDTVTMIYADGGDAWLDEDAEVSAPSFLAANLACEGHLARFAGSGGTAVALRFAQFYGPDDRMTRSAVASARRGFWTMPGAPTAWTSAVHTDDAGSAVALAAVMPGLGSGVYNVADDEPLLTADLLDVVAEAAGRRRLRTPLTAVARMVPLLARSNRVRSQRFRAATGWSPVVATRREGWPALFA
jgi:2-alkyl-3-oxoalkanoate reductase